MKVEDSQDASPSKKNPTGIYGIVLSIYVIVLFGVLCFLFALCQWNVFKGYKEIDYFEDSKPRDPSRDLLLLKNNNEEMAVLNLEGIVMNSSSYSIHFNPNISGEEASDFLCSSVQFCLQKEKNREFGLSFRLWESPMLSADLLKFIKKWLEKRNLSVSYDGIDYENEQSAFKDYMEQILREHGIVIRAPHHAFIGDFYLDRREGKEIILGDPCLYVNVK